MLDPNADPVKLLAKHEQGPEKKVLSHDELINWHRSHAYFDLIGYINATSTHIQGVKNSDQIYESDMIRKLCAIFDKLDDIIDKNPPLEQPQRFGNKAYRSWARTMYRDVFFMLEQVVPQSKCHLLNELGQYISQSFGNSTRIDYGTGHELSFMFFLCALFKGDILKENDTMAAALRLFNRYLIFVRRLQRVYNMEPAGSQGVWSLDDYQFVPFIWGSAQLSFNSPFNPENFVDENIIAEFKNEYMFIGCIDYISQMKTGHFGEHSNQLWSITAVPSWIKINSGLVKMYQKEILSKFPVMQHVYFGELMSYEPMPPGSVLANARLGFAQSTTNTSSKFNMGPPRTAPKATPAAETPMSQTAVEGSSSYTASKSGLSSDVSALTRPRIDSESTVAVTEQSSGHLPSVGQSPVPSMNLQNEPSELSNAASLKFDTRPPTVNSSSESSENT